MRVKDDMDASAVCPPQLRTELPHPVPVSCPSSGDVAPLPCPPPLAALALMGVRARRGELGRDPPPPRGGLMVAPRNPYVTGGLGVEARDPAREGGAL